MMINIYILLLNTMSRNLLPFKTNKKSILISWVYRISFILFLAIVISKPIEVKLLEARLDQDILEYKNEQLKNYAVFVKNYYQKQDSLLLNEINRIVSLGSNNTTLITYYNSKLIENSQLRFSMIYDMDILINKSSYFTQRLILINNNYPWCWLITLITFVIFTLPVAIKLTMDEDDEFHQAKRFIEVNLVETEYKLFKDKYISICNNKLDRKHTINEKYIDAPFNTILKEDETKYSSQDILVEKIYNGQ
jgi:hypothetical protein